MKNLSEIINEGMITESAAKDVKIPRKGSTIYILKDGETKAIAVKVANVLKVKSSWYGRSGGYDVDIELEDNSIGVTGWRTMHYADPKLDEPIQVDTKSIKDIGTVYIGTSKEAISEFIKSSSSKKLKVLLKQIEDAENELAELNRQKDELQQRIDTEITESKKE